APETVAAGVPRWRQRQCVQRRLPHVGGRTAAGEFYRFVVACQTDERRNEPAPVHSITSFAGEQGRRYVERDSRNGFYEISTADRAHSALMLAARITLPHFSVSSAMSLPKSAGEPASAVPPRSASRAFILGSARGALISLLSFSTISAGVAFGAPTPVQ